MVANLSSGEVLVSSHWDGYSMKNRTENNVPKLRYVHPREGIIGWFDSLVVPISASNKTNAEKFINFMMDAKNGAEISNFNRYASPLDPGAIANYIDPELARRLKLISTPVSRFISARPVVRSRSSCTTGSGPRYFNSPVSVAFSARITGR